MNKKLLSIILLIVGGSILGFLTTYTLEKRNEKLIVQMVKEQAKAWETGDETLLASLLHKDVVFAYPSRRLNKEQTLEDLRFFRESYIDTKVYIHKIIVDGNNVGVEWQFATTKKETGKREVVSDTIIGEVKDGQFIIWKEYLDGRVKGLQAEGKLELEEGMSPFPWPKKTESF